MLVWESLGWGYGKLKSDFENPHTDAGNIHLNLTEHTLHYAFVASWVGSLVDILSRTISRGQDLRFLVEEGEIDKEYCSYLCETFTCSEKVFWCGSPFLDTATSQHWRQELANKHTWPTSWSLLVTSVGRNITSLAGKSFCSSLQDTFPIPSLISTILTYQEINFCPFLNHSFICPKTNNL